MALDDDLTLILVYAEGDHAILYRLFRQGESQRQRSRMPSADSSLRSKHTRLFAA